MLTPFKIAVFASGGGGNFRAILESKKLSNVTVSYLLVDRECGAIGVAREFGIPVKVINCKKENEDSESDWRRVLVEPVDLIVLAGFIPLVPAWICQQWKGKIINTHPSLLPKYGGRGMVGVKVQEAVMAAGEEFAGCTVHYVDEGVDTGEIIAQRSILVDYSETPWQLGGRVFHAETLLLPEVIYELSQTRGH